MACAALIAAISSADVDALVRSTTSNFRLPTLEPIAPFVARSHSLDLSTRRIFARRCPVVLRVSDSYCSGPDSTLRFYDPSAGSVGQALVAFGFRVPAAVSFPIMRPTSVSSVLSFPQLPFLVSRFGSLQCPLNRYSTVAHSDSIFSHSRVLWPRSPHFRRVPLCDLGVCNFTGQLKAPKIREHAKGRSPVRRRDDFLISVKSISWPEKTSLSDDTSLGVATRG